MHDRDGVAVRLPDPGPRGAAVGTSRTTGPEHGTGGRRDRPGWLAPAAVGALTAAATVVLAVRSPHESGSYGICPLLAVTGWWCPACGGLRAVHELTQLDVVGAWSMNPLFVLGAPVLVAVWALWLARGLGRGPSPWSGVTWPAWTFLVVSVAFAVARNVPALEPWLAPV